MKLIENLEAEQSVLGCILIDPLTLQDCSLTPSDFSSSTNKTIYGAIKALQKDGTSIDLVTLKTKLESEKKLDSIGWILTLVELTDIVPTTSNFTAYTKLVSESATSRRLQQISEQIKGSLKNEASPDEIMWQIYKELQIIEDWAGSTEEKIADILEETVEYLERIKSDDLLGVSFWSQFVWLDQMTGWIQPWTITRIWWGSNVGKSWLLFNFLLSVLFFDDRVTFAAVENANTFTMKNLLGLKKGVNSLPHMIKAKDYNFSDEFNWFAERENFYIDSKHKNLDDIFRTTLKNKSKYLFIDYIQAVEIPWKFANDIQKYASYSLRVQQFASKYNVAVIDLSQLSNETSRGWAKGAGSSEFSWGWNLKASADIGIHIFNDDLKMDAKSSAVENWEMENFFQNFVHVKLSKNRLWGGVGTVEDYNIDFDQGWKYLKFWFK